MRRIKIVIRYPRHVEREKELYTPLRVASEFSYELIRKPRVERERKLTELAKVSTHGEILSLRKVIDVLEAKGKRMTLGKLKKAMGVDSGDFEERHFRGITVPAQSYEILTNTTDHLGRGYGLFEWANCTK